jgi:histidine triad (HIT) family protein
MLMAYDDTNLFAKIIRGEIPSQKVYEDDFVLAFRDISPVKKIHVLIVPKGPYNNVVTLGEAGSDQDILGLMRAIPKVVDALNLRESGFRLIVNCGPDSCLHMPHHMHIHIIGGENLGSKITS